MIPARSIVLMSPWVVHRDARCAGHWGLRGVRERAERIGARLDFGARLEPAPRFSWPSLQLSPTKHRERASDQNSSTN